MAAFDKLFNFPVYVLEVLRCGTSFFFVKVPLVYQIIRHPVLDKMSSPSKLHWQSFPVAIAISAGG